MAPESRSPWRAAGGAAHLGITMVVATVLGLAGGYYADRWLGTSPWLALVGLFFGIAAAFVEVFRTIKRLDEEERGSG